MAASALDKFKKVGEAGTLTTLAAPGKALAAASINVGSTTNWPTDTGIVFAIRQVDATGDLVAGTYTEWKGTVGVNTLNNLTLAYGTDQVYPAGSTSQVFIPVSATRENDLIAGLIAEHSQLTGVHSLINGNTVPAGTDTVTLNTATQTLTNKTISTGSNINVAGVAVQAVATNYSAVATGTTLIPYDDTIPQITEGTEFMTQAITPKATTNRLVIEATLHVSHSVIDQIQVALFQDATANALASTSQYQAQATGGNSIKLTHEMAAGTVSATTFRIRAGGNAAGTTTFNGQGGARRFGGITVSNIRITEVRV